MKNLTNPDPNPNEIISDPYLQPICKENICNLFSEVAKKHPNCIAAIFEDLQITYEELDKKSTTLAHYLISQGVKSETIVGLSVVPDLNLLIGILGILKAGAAYFPLDPYYPDERLRYMLNDANPILLLTHSNFKDKFCNSNKPLICLDGIDWNNLIDQTSIINQLPENSPDQLAYLIYTSGSTGNPKGIMIPFGSFAHFATMHTQYYPQNIVGLVTGSISFDISTLTIFHVLIAGGTVCFPKPVPGFDATETIDLINKRSINYLLCVPSLYSVLLEKKQLLPSLKTVSLAGESIPKGLPELHAQFSPNAILYNEYAPSECACGATLARIYDPSENKIQPITIGKPLPNTELYLLDQDQNPVQPGNKGEIFLGGFGLALGYLNRTELTSERFIELSFSGRKVRLYRTGDYGRILPDGNLEFLGRMDYQVKIRGYRIELTEIEYVMCNYDGVTEAAVIAKEDSKGVKRLISYFSSRLEKDISSDLREYLIKTLPSQMIPSILLKIPTFPRTPNGKIDRDALARLDIEEKRSLEDISPPTNTEEMLIQIWKEVLNLEKIGIKDNFFEMGGDSLNIVRLQTFIQTTFQIDVPVVELLQYPTIHRLALHLNSQKSALNIRPDKKLADKKKNAFLRFKKGS